MTGKPFWESKKFWTAVVTSGAMLTAYLAKDEQLAMLVTAIGTALIAGFGLADMGKERSL